MTTETHHFSDFGSVSDYALERDLDVHDPDTISSYGKDLNERKMLVASQIGIDPQDFHLRPMPIADTKEASEA